MKRAPDVDVPQRSDESAAQPLAVSIWPGGKRRHARAAIRSLEMADPSRSSYRKAAMASGRPGQRHKIIS